MTVDLKPCPFYGSEDLNEFTHTQFSQFGYRHNQIVECNECHAEQQKKMWNIRHEPKEKL